MVNSVHDNYVLYDGECPVCNNYIAWSRLKTIQPDLELINARNAPELVNELRSKGIEVNNTMVVKIGTLQLHGADAFSFISEAGKPNSKIISFLMHIFSYKWITTFLYPVLVVLRKILLFILGKKPIR